MTPRERRDASLEFAARSDQEFEHGGNSMIAAELLWGAVAQAMIAISEINEWPRHGHGGLPTVHDLVGDSRLWLLMVRSGDTG